MWVRSLGQKDPLQKNTAGHSSILAWEISWGEEPGGLQSTEGLRVGHDLATEVTEVTAWTMPSHIAVMQAYL